MMAEVNATIRYTDQQVAPLMQHQMRVEFIPQAIPFFAAQQTFNALSSERPDYTFRQPADDPTNPSDRPTPWEEGIVASFRTNPALRTLVSERSTQEGRILSLSQPVRAASADCLVCHSTPDRAPRSMIAVYGQTNGFGWKLGQVVGAQIVSVPERIALARAHSILLRMMAVFALVFVVTIGVLNLLLHWLIIAPVRRMSRLADEVSLGNMEVPEFGEANRDEIGLLARSFNRMRRSLAAAFQMLEDH
jgi:protein-histidine pros-kinase